MQRTDSSVSNLSPTQSMAVLKNAKKGAADNAAPLPMEVTDLNAAPGSLSRSFGSATGSFFFNSPVKELQGPSMMKEANRKRRQRVYLGEPTACPSSKDSQYHWPKAVVDGLDSLDREPSAKIYAPIKVGIAGAIGNSGSSNSTPATAASPSGSPNISTPVEQAPKLSGATQKKPPRRKQADAPHYNTMNELHKDHFAKRFWVCPESQDITEEELNDVGPDMAMDVPYPTQGFFNNVPLEQDGSYDWMLRWNQLYNKADNDDRTAALDAYVAEFCNAAVPLVVYCINAVEDLPSSIVHHKGITVELCGLTRDIHDMFPDDPHSAQKVASREYQARRMALNAGCMQVIVPFTICVQHVGINALAYPRIPVDLVDNNNNEHVYGCMDPTSLDKTPVVATDPEMNAIMRRMGAKLQHKGHWMGREFNDKRFMDGPFDCKGFRSALDNRLYLTNLRRFPASTINKFTADTNDYYHHRMRPEFMEKQVQEPLSSGSACQLCRINVEKDEAERNAAVKHLLTYVIPQAAEQMARDMRLNGVTDELLREGGVSNFLHSWGINLRYLPEVQRKLARTQFSQNALTAIETEMTVRAMKDWMFQIARPKGAITIERIPAEECIRALCAPFTEEFWTKTVWPQLKKKYMVLQDGPTWSAERIPHHEFLARFMWQCGVKLSKGTETLSLDEILDLQHEGQLSHTRIAFVPRVKCPHTPKAPFPDGQKVYLMITSKRFLREQAIEYSYSPVLKNKAQVTKYIAFLSNLGESKCEEIEAIYIAEAERKERAGKTKVVTEVVSDDVVKYRVKGGKGMRDFSVSDEALQPFKLQHGQRVQATLGSRKGLVSTIIGVLDGTLWRHDDGEDGAEEVVGRNASEVTANYGFVVLSRISIVKRRFGGKGLTRPGVQDPLHLVNERGGLQIIEKQHSQMVHSFGFCHGDRLQFRRGPRTGAITTILGYWDGALWHHIDGEAHPESIRHADHHHLMETYDFVVFSRGATVPQHPIDTVSVFDGQFDLYAGYRQSLQYGFYYRQMVQFGSSGYVGEIGVVVGAHHGSLQVLVKRRPIPVDVGVHYESIQEKYSLKVVGTLSYEPRPTPPPPTLFYEADNGEPLLFDVSCSKLLAETGVVTGQRIKLQEGVNTGNCGVIVGWRKGRLWAHFECDNGAVPVTQGSFEILHASIFDAESYTDPSLVRERVPDGPLSIRVLAQFGEVINLDVSPAACEPWKYFHGQRLQVQPRPLAPLQRKAKPVECIVVGCALGELWYKLASETFVRPFQATDRWSLDATYCCSPVVGLGAVAPWVDMFCMNHYDTVRLTNFDESIAREGFEVFMTVNGDVVGIDVRDESIATVWSAWKHGTTIVRQDTITTVNVDGQMVHRPAGPQAIVTGTMYGNVYVCPRERTDGRLAILHPHELPKWLVCEDWRAAERKPFVDLLPTSKDYPKRAGIIRPEEPIEGMLWGIVLEDPPNPFCLVDHQTNRGLSGLIEADKGRKYYDEVGTAYDVEQMTCQVSVKEVFPLRHEGFYTTLGYTRHCYNIDLSPPGAHVLLLGIEKRAKEAYIKLFKRSPPSADYLPGREGELATYFIEETLPALTEAIEAVPDLFTSYLEEVATKMPDEASHEVSLRYSMLPPKIRTVAVRWVLSLFSIKWRRQYKDGVTPFAVLAALEHHLGRPLDVPTADEFVQHLEQMFTELAEEEAIQRQKIIQEAANLHPLGTSAPRNRRSTVFVSRQIRLQLPNNLEATRRHILADAKYVLESGEMVNFMPSHMSLQRGDVVKYTYGDVSGVTATILGMLHGRLWRYEHTGFYANKAMAFEGDEATIVRTYGLQVVKSLARLPASIAKAEVAKVRRSDTMRHMLWDGSMADFVIDYDSCRQFGAMCGERYVATAETSEKFPYADAVLVVIGVLKERLWFSVDQTGAVPFPMFCTAPIEEFKLKRLYWAVVDPPRHDRSCLFRYYGLLAEREQSWLGEFGTVTLLYNIAPEAVGSFGSNARPLMKLFCNAGQFKGRRVVLVGVRHGVLCVIRDQDGATRPLLDSTLAELRPRLIPGDHRGKESSLPIPPFHRGDATTERYFRFPVHSGTLSIFDVSNNCNLQFGMKSGQRFTFRISIKGPGGRPIEEIRNATCVGIRAGILWRVDDGDRIAKPFIGCDDRVSLHLKYRVEPGELVNFPSKTG